MPMKDTLHIHEVKYLIEWFQEEVEDKYFDKMPYAKWRQLNADLDKFQGDIEVSWDEECITFHALTFAFDDGSFGSFLYEVYIQPNNDKYREIPYASNHSIACDTAAAASDEIMDVEIFNFDGAQFLYRMPVAISTIQTGDVIVHAGVPMFVEQVLDKSIYAIDPVAGEKKEVLLTKSPFGFNFATKVVNFLDGFMGNATPNAENPFGNMWMLMALNGNGDMDMSTIAMMAMANGQNGLNPQMMLPLLLTQNGKGNMNENLAMVMAMQAMNQPHVCHCHNNGDQ